MAALDLRPLGVGEILDLGIKIYRRRFGSLVRAVAVVVVPVAIISAVIQTSVSFDAETSIDGGDAAAIAVGSIIAGLLSYLATQLATGACFDIVSGDYLEEEHTWQDSLRVARGKLGSLIWLSFLYGLALVIGAIACFIGTIYFYVAFSVAVPVLLFEGERGSKALRRSRSLVEGRWWPTFGLLVVVTILTSIVGAGLGGIFGGIISTTDNEAVASLSRAISSSLSSILVTPFTASVYSVLYFDFRVRKEGFDLELLARQIGSPLPEGERPTFAPEPQPEQPPYWPPPPGWRSGGVEPEPDA